MEPPVTEWKWFVLTSLKSSPHFPEVRNAILYADKVVWVPVEVFGLFLLELEYGRRLTQGEKEVFDMYERASGIDTALILRDRMRDYGLSRHEFEYAWDSEEFQNVLLKPGKGNTMADRPASRFGAALNLAQTDCRTIITPDDGFEHPAPWNTYFSATSLIRGLSRLLLPDVSSLPLEALAEMRNHLKPSLNPMRAEMLRFTEDLRKIVNDETDPKETEREASNLIASRVEPVVREVAARSEAMVKKRWRKFYMGAAKAFGFLGASYLDPKLLAKAVQQTLEAGALAFGKAEEEKSTQPRATAEFVLHAGTVARKLKT